MKALTLFVFAFLNVSISMAALPTCVKSGQKVEGVENFFGGQRTWSMRQSDGTRGTLKINFKNPMATTLNVKPGDGSEPLPFTIKGVYYNSNNCSDLRASVDTFTRVFGVVTPVSIEVKFKASAGGKLQVSGAGQTFNFTAGASASAAEQLDALPEGLFPEQSTRAI